MPQGFGFIPAARGGARYVLDYMDSGCVKDDEAKDLDADKLLAPIRAGAGKDNQHRAAMGLPAFEVIGWAPGSPG